MTILNNILHVTGRDQGASVADAAVRVSFEFEEGKPHTLGVIETLARSAQIAVHKNPFLAASCPFFEAAKAPDWLGGRSLSPANGTGDGPTSGKVQRLRAIKCGSELLLEHTYGPDGRIATTRYFDGEEIVHEWDDLSRSYQIRCKSGRQTLIKLRGDDLPHSITYDDARFQYEYDTAGNILQICYPDQMRVRRDFGLNGRLSSISSGPLQIHFRWNASLEMDGFTVANGAKTFEFDSKTKSIKCDLECVSKTQCQSHYNTHPLGAWVMNEDMTLREMVTPWGERFRVDAFGTNGPSRVWTSAGVQHFDYNSRGGFKAVTFPNGSRSAVYPIEGQDRALLVGPGAITLLELDKMRRLRKVRSSDGRYSLIDYTRDGQVKSVASFGDTITLFRDNRHRLSAVHSDAGYACHFLNSQSGDLTGFSAEGLRTATSENLLRMLKSLWQCLGLRTVQAFVVC